MPRTFDRLDDAARFAPLATVGVALLVALSDAWDKHAARRRQREIDERDRRISDLERRLADLEAAGNVVAR
jgi:transcription elongation GreA/GreB family factor